MELNLYLEAEDQSELAQWQKEEADKRAIGNEYLLAKAYADGRPPTIIKGPRWNFPHSLVDVYGDDIATNDYSGEDVIDLEGDGHDGTTADCTVGDSIPVSFSRTQLQLTQKTQTAI